MIKDEVIITADKFSELRHEFKTIWNTEPLKLNAFISGGEFALYDMNAKLLAKNGCFDIDFHYSIYKKVLTITDYRHGYEGKIRNLHIVRDIMSSHYNALQQDIEIAYEDLHRKKALQKSCEHVGKEPEDWICDLGVFYFIFNLVIMNLPNKIKSEKKKVSETQQVKKNGKTTYKNVVYLRNSYVIDDKFKLNKSEIKHIIKCPCWGVRGHKRHLRNGTIIYIKPYAKGKYRNDSEKYISKTYKT